VRQVLFSHAPPHGFVPESVQGRTEQCTVNASHQTGTVIGAARIPHIPRVNICLTAQLRIQTFLVT